MAITQADVDALEAACNSGVLTVTFDGPPRRSITYQSLPDMRARLAEMKVSLARQSSGRTGYVLIKTSKGL